MLRIGLTGGIGSGKSTVASEFKKLGVGVIDLDQISRELVAPGTETLSELVEHFGPKILLDDESLNRKLLRQIIFDNPTEKNWLEALLHPRIRNRQLELEMQISSPYCVIEIPLLVENIESQQVDRILVVETDPEKQIRRVIQRSGLPQEEIEKIIGNQASSEERRLVADDLIDNTQNMASLGKQVVSLDQKYRKLASAIPGRE